MLINRILTALVAIPLLLVLIFLGSSFHFFLLICLVAAIGLYEYFGFALPDEQRWAKVFGWLLGMVIFFTASIAPDKYISHALGIVLPGLLIWTLFYEKETKKSLDNAGLMLLGIFYAGFLFSYLVHIRDQEFGSKWILTLLVATWAQDTGAYFAGRWLGRNKLFPRVSPGKTWEGAIGGLLASVVGVVLARWIYFPHLVVFDCVILGIGVGVVGPLGDLCQSMMKRSRGVKDSGKILPGHGGILDRLDSLLFSAPFMYYYIKVVII